MPYFIDLERRQVVVMPPGTAPAAGQAVVDRYTAEACDLRHGQLLNEAEVTALLDGSPTTFRAAAAQDSTVRAPGPTGRLGDTTAQSSRSAAAKRANGVAATVEAISWFFLGLSVLGGFIIALQTGIDEFGQQEHPHVLTGIAVAVGGVFQSLVVIMIATYIQARTEE